LELNSRHPRRHVMPGHGPLLRAGLVGERAVEGV
jgi:hypothetical protein